MKKLALGLFISLASCGQSHKSLVVVIEKTNSYHRESCAKVRMAQTKTEELSSVIAQHMKPCPYCKPI